MHEKNAEKRDKNKEKQTELNRQFKEVTGGYNKKALGVVIVSFILCISPLFMLGLLLLIPSVIWLITDTIKKGLKFKKHMKESSKNV